MAKMTRDEANMKLLARLKYYLSDNKDIRFGQALINLGLVPSDREIRSSDLFYEESTKTLDRANGSLK